MTTDITDTDGEKKKKEKSLRGNNGCVMRVWVPVGAVTFIFSLDRPFKNVFSQHVADTLFQ